MPKFKDLTGKRFERLTVIKCTQRSSRQKSSTMWLCLCDCGNEKEIMSSHLIEGSSKSCSCLQRERAAIANTKHGLKGSRIYDIFENMIERCYNPLNPAFPDYGGRGIYICKEWLKDRMEFFRWSTESGYSDILTIDRIDNSKGYYSENCRWVTREQQNKNKRSNVLIKINGKTKILNDWAREYGINHKTLSHRLENGWDPVDAITIPPIIGRNQSNGRR